MDVQMNRARLNSISTAMQEYRQQENRLRNLARIATSNEQRNTYTIQADSYRSRRYELFQNIANVHQIATPAVNRERLVPSTYSYTIPQSRPISIPDTISEIIPNEFLCPITTEIMKDPVILTDGHVYEKQAIKQWLSNHDTSPMTKVKVDKNIIIPCFVLRKLIQDFTSNATSSNIEIKKKHKKIKDQNKPKRQPSRYNIYVKEHMPRIKEQHPGFPLTQLIKIIATEWNVYRQQQQA
jgi:hypothetical protein